MSDNTALHAVVRPAPLAIGSRLVGPGEPVYVVAEAGVNHNGDPALALKLVDAAADAGADAIKFQTFSADRVASPAAPKARYQLDTTLRGESQVAMLKHLELDAGALSRVVDRCRGRGITFLSTPFDEAGVDLLVGLGVPAFKIASGELTNVFLLRRAAQTGKPIILSTGMAYLGEVADAIAELHRADSGPLILLHCVTQYPAKPTDVHLRAMRTMEEAFGVPVGYSDHTDGTDVALAAVALGACLVEKHVTLDRGLPGPDHQASLEPPELAALVKGIRRVELAIGTPVKQPRPSELENRAVVRRSLAVTEPLPAGTTLGPDMLCALRPGTGLAPAFIDRLVGRRLRRSLAAGELIAWSDLE